MLVVISDLHLTDGSSGETIHAGAFRTFVENLESSVEDACWREGGKFIPIERCDLVLLGDVLDVIRSDRWLRSGDLRPWSGNDKIGATVDVVTEAILKHNAEAIEHLRKLGGKLVVEDPGGKPVEIPFAIHYFVGNHDWFYHVEGPAFDSARARVVAAFGLADDPKRPFPHRLEEANPEILARIRAHRLYVQHGDVHDEMNYEANRGRNYSSLGDCIVVELVNRFPVDVAKALDLSQDHPDFRALREIDNVRPLLAVPSWIRGTLRRSSLPENAKERVMEIWDERVEQFLEIPFVRGLDVFGWDKVDMLEVGLKLTSGFSLQVLSALSDRLSPLARSDTYARYALTEEALLKQDADFVAYGHTHHPETVPLDLVVGSAGEVREQVYFNTGTWRRVHQRCIRQPGALEFINFHVMTYLSLFRSGERSGRRYETWTGQLG